MIEADSEGIKVKELSLVSSKGRYQDGKIAINKAIETSIEKACVLAEELGHHYTVSGDILDLSKVISRKREYRGRLWGYNRLLGLQGIIDAYKNHCQNLYEMAEYLDVTEEFLQEALDCYRSKYGVFTTLDNYIIYFEPNLGVLEMTAL